MNKSENNNNDNNNFINNFSSLVNLLINSPEISDITNRNIFSQSDGKV